MQFLRTKNLIWSLADLFANTTTQQQQYTYKSKHLEMLGALIKFAWKKILSSFDII